MNKLTEQQVEQAEALFILICLVGIILFVIGFVVYSNWHSISPYLLSPWTLRISLLVAGLGIGWWQLRKHRR